MKAELISTVFLSEKRKSALLMLMDGPATVDEIKDSLTGTTSAIMAQVKILLEQGLIEQKEDGYRLTHIGKIIMKKIKPLVEALDVVQENKGYWDSRNLGCIPEYLLDRIGELGEILVHEPDLNHLFEPPSQLLKSLHQTTNVYTFYSYFCPTCPYNYAELSNKNVNFHLLLTQPVYDRLKDEYTDQYNAMMESENAHLYICNNDTLKLGALSITDDMMLIAFFNKEGIFDHKKVLSFEESARQWGKDLFLHYKEKSEKVK
ncbi:winged helix-turn-helix domain-containing protein [Methanolobus mangrovi]|uniref:Winged helix-turn-helix domain-containing protein n=1 Tax=Methanolobus mangrovi TaxID=3072977 RepID=A0AA51UJW6_9EURY|nr:winged helix-turn-helix domain-containing protein [Methanolobus mangrovi]WMW23051.1 winged helix-turn-helix domain-containing protein [Methanolobus mangrovi]